MEHRQDTIDTILSQPPHQLPPVILTGGCYCIDVKYLDKEIHITAFSLEDALTRYLYYVTRANYLITRRIDPLTDAPVRPGSTLPHSIPIQSQISNENKH